MDEQAMMTQAFFLQGFRMTYADLQEFIGDLTPEQFTTLTDAAGWTVKDHLAHIAVWAQGMVATLRKESRIQAMGLTEWRFGHHFDEMNEEIRQLHKDKSTVEVLAMLQSAHDGFVSAVSQMSDADLRRPYKEFQADSDRETPIWNYIAGNGPLHYLEHIPWMGAIAGIPIGLSGFSHLLMLNDTWMMVQDFANKLTPEQLTVNHDPAGWTVKDHLAHLAAWDDGLVAVLHKKPMREYMQIDEASWNDETYFATNDIIYKRYAHLSWLDVQAMMNDVHSRLLAIIEPWSETDWKRPYKEFQSDSESKSSIGSWVGGVTYGHYAEHMPWMEKIAKGE